MPVTGPVPVAGCVAKGVVTVVTAKMTALVSISMPVIFPVTLRVVAIVATIMASVEAIGTVAITVAALVPALLAVVPVPPFDPFMVLSAIPSTAIPAVSPGCIERRRAKEYQCCQGKCGCQFCRFHQIPPSA